MKVLGNNWLSVGKQISLGRKKKCTEPTDSEEENWRVYELKQQAKFWYKQAWQTGRTEIFIFSCKVQIFSKNISAKGHNRLKNKITDRWNCYLLRFKVSIMNINKTQELAKTTKHRETHTKLVSGRNTTVREQECQLWMEYHLLKNHPSDLTNLSSV